MPLSACSGTATPIEFMGRAFFGRARSYLVARLESYMVSILKSAPARRAAVAAAFVGPVAAHAATTVDVTPITEAGAAVAAVGAAVFAVWAGMQVWKWIKRV